jgi:hypothetical protein
MRSGGEERTLAKGDVGLFAAGHGGNSRGSFRAKLRRASRRWCDQAAALDRTDDEIARDPKRVEKMRKRVSYNPFTLIF